MEAATPSRTSPPSGPLQVVLIASLLIVAAGAWAAIGDRVGGMDAGQGAELAALPGSRAVWLTIISTPSPGHIGKIFLIRRQGEPS